GAGDGGEMMAEQHIAVGRHVIEAIVATIGGRLPRRVDPQHLVGNEQRVEAVGDEVDAHRRDHEPRRVDRLAAGEGDDAERHRAQQDDSTPQQLVHHGYSPTPSRVRYAIAGTAPRSGSATPPQDQPDRRSGATTRGVTLPMAASWTDTAKPESPALICINAPVAAPVT